MGGILSLAGCMMMLPVFYIGGIVWCRPSFEKDENQTRKPLRSPAEMTALIAAEIVLAALWWKMGCVSILEKDFLMAYLMLVVILVLCFTDYWEHIVPNKVLLLVLLVWFVITGSYAMADMNEFQKELPYILLGLVFCLICFGFSFLLSRGSMGAGDVKLSLIMGLVLTGHYVAGPILYGSIISAVYSIIMLVRKKLVKTDAIPFVPFLYMGLLVSYITR